MAADFVTQNFWYIFGALFLVGTLLLSRTKHERFIKIIFLLRTKHGVRHLDRVATISPSGWRFVADVAIIIAYSGFGVLYVSRYRNPAPFMPVLGMLGLTLAIPLLGPMNAAMAFAVLLAITAVLWRASLKIQKPVFFIMAAAILFTGTLGFLGGTTMISYAGALVTGIIGLPGLLIAFLGVQASQIVFAQSTIPGVTPLLPGVSSSGEIGFIFPGTQIFIPLLSGIATLFILLASHELCHGILSRAEKIKVKSMGIATFGLYPIGAFVEPDEQAFERSKSESRMRVLAMGSFANLVVAALSLLLMGLVGFQAVGMMETAGVEIISVQEGMPAAVFEPGTIITAVNSIPVATLDEYLKEAESLRPGDSVVLETDQGEFTLTAVPRPEDPGSAQLGYSLQTKSQLKAGFESQRPLFDFFISVMSFLSILFLFNFSVAMFNLMPAGIVDGGKMFSLLLGTYSLSDRSKKWITNMVIYIILGLLLVNALPLGRLFG